MRVLAKARRRAVMRVGFVGLVGATAIACIFDKGGYEGGGRRDTGNQQAATAIPTDLPIPTSTSTSTAPGTDSGKPDSGGTDTGTGTDAAAGG